MKLSKNHKQMKSLVRDMKDTTIFDRETRRNIIERENITTNVLPKLSPYLVGTMCIFPALSLISGMFNIADKSTSDSFLFSYISLLTASGTYMLYETAIAYKNHSYKEQIKKTAEAQRQHISYGRLLDRKLEPYTLEKLEESY